MEISKELLGFVSDGDLSIHHENTKHSTNVREIVTLGYMEERYKAEQTEVESSESMTWNDWIQWMNRLEDVLSIKSRVLRNKRLRALKNDLELAYQLPSNGNWRAKRFYEVVVAGVN